MRLPVGALVALAAWADIIPSVPTLWASAAEPVAPTLQGQPVVPVGGGTASLDVSAGPEVATLGITAEQARRALGAFQLSCPALLSRIDRTGLTTPADWRDACFSASKSGDAQRFFTENFETVRVGDGQAFATGYYEPEIAASLVRDEAHNVPIYARPDDLIEIDLGAFQAALAGKRIDGRFVAGQFLPYFDRAEIEAGALSARVPVLAWAADPIEFFFLQVQGSGRLRLPDGRVMRIGYAGQNGRDYVGIGALMRDRGLIVPGQLSMQGVMAWLRAHPGDAPGILRENKSFVFFREVTGPGPIGALSVPVTPRGSVAADPGFVPMGAPVWLDLDRPEARGLWIAQDTGGAIKGANRFDTFWGAGDEARLIAGGMSGRGAALLLVPRGTLARHLATAGDGARP